MSWAAADSSKSDTIVYSHLSNGASDNTTGETFQHSENSLDSQLTKHISWFQRHTTGWRFGVLSGATSASVVFIINLSIFVWAEKYNGYTPFHFTRYDNGQHTLFNGSCKETRRLNTGVHLLINVLSTLLLSASNYCMQCMSAPTRKDVDDAHARRKWLDVGVQSMRNLFRISWKRTVLYCLLGLTSLPLHLFYNSTVFSSIAANDYYVYSANAAFASGKSTNFTGYGYGSDDAFNNWAQHVPNGTANQLFKLARAGALARIEPADCLTAYSQPFQTSRGSLILIAPDDSTPQFNEGTAAIWYEYYENIPDNTGNSCPFDWMCFNNPVGVDKNCNQNGVAQCQFRLGKADSNITSWQPFHKQVLYCLTETIEEHCKLEYSTHLAVLVIVLNAVKAMLMFYLAVGISEAPLMTVGDAVASFLGTPDPSTQGMCLVTKEEIRDAAKKGAGWVPIAKQYVGRRRRRFAAASRLRWIISIGLVISAMVLVAALLIWGMSAIPSASRSAVFSLGLGAVTPATFIRWHLPSKGASGLVTNVLIANIPQVVLSFIYFAYNALFTCMSLAAEWSIYALERRGVRVSEVPLGHQRGKYFLQLPYRFALPLLGVSALLHWLVSESIFLVAIDDFKIDKTELTRMEMTSGGFMTCGYSPVAMVCVIVVGCVMLVAAVGSGYVKLGSGMPIVGSCSAAISAGCHGDAGGSGQSDDRRGQERVMWGVIESEEFDVGHCGMSDRAVTGAVEGRWYAGTGVRRRC